MNPRPTPANSHGHTVGDDPTPARPETPGPGYGQTPAGPVRRQHARPHPVELVQDRRALFWQNIVREILMGMAAAAAAEAAQRPTDATAAPPLPPSDGDDTQEPDDALPTMFDGRMGVITSQGQRIPIADVVPVFACSAPRVTDDHTITDDIQCTIFRLKTPAGESYTLPVSQIVGFHSMSDALADQLEQAAREMEETDDDGNKMPFGFAAYTSLARAEAQDAADTPPAASNPPQSR